MLIADQLGDQSQTGEVQAQWFRPPVADERCPFTGLGHGAFYKLLNAPFSAGFVQVTLRVPGAHRGTRLVFKPSLHRFLTDLSDGSVRVNRSNKLEGGLVYSRFERALGEAVENSWIKAPANGRICAFTGLGHAPFYRLVGMAGKRLKQARIQTAGEVRATMLVNRREVHCFLVELAIQQARERGELVSRDSVLSR